MSKTVQIRARTDAKTKRDAERILDKLGLNASAAINMFYRQIVMQEGLPFPVEIPNLATRKAIDDARAGRDVTEGDDLSSLLTALLTKDERTIDVADLLAEGARPTPARRRAAKRRG